MRAKDKNKKTAIFNATIKVINELGFANASMSKIAKAAGVSASTLYIYYENQEDMFKKIYLEAKKQMLITTSKGLRVDDSVEMSIKKLCNNLLEFINSFNDYFFFLEQSSSSPLVTSEMFEEVAPYAKDTIAVFEKGIKDGVLKNAPPLLLIGFCIYPISQIYKEGHQRGGGLLKDMDFDLVIKMCLDAVKK